MFQQHYGSSSLVVAAIWYDLWTTEIQAAKLTGEEKSQQGFKRFMMVLFFLWTYPKNRGLIQTRFKMCRNYCGGKRLWEWIEKIAALKDEVIIWEDELNDPDTETFILSVDCTDLRTWEPSSHPFLNIDKKEMSHKHNHAAKKFEIALSLFRPQIAFISGPHSGGTHDLTVFRQRLKYRILDGKLVIADRGYQTSKEDERMFSLPNLLDPSELYNFKSRACLHHEKLNDHFYKSGCMPNTL